MRRNALPSQALSLMLPIIGLKITKIKLVYFPYKVINQNEYLGLVTELLVGFLMTFAVQNQKKII